MGLEFFSGRTAVSIQEDGRTGSSMDEGSMLIVKVLNEKENGSREDMLDGLNFKIRFDIILEI